MVPACHTKVVQKHPSFLKLFQWSVKRFPSGKATKMCCGHSFSFHCISVAESVGELRSLGMEIKKHFLMLPAQMITQANDNSKCLSSPALTAESCLTCHRCNALFGVQKTVAETGSFGWFVGFLSVAEPVIAVRSADQWLLTIPHGSAVALPSIFQLFCSYEGW